MTRPSKKNLTKQMAAVDLFCGAGGLTRGLLDAGIPVLAGYDIDSACQFAYEHNNPGPRFVTQSVADLTAENLLKVYGVTRTRVLVGCAPCQPFSKYTQGQNPREDAKWGLLHEFGRLVVAVRPEIVSMENVPELLRHEVFQDFLQTLKDADYHVSYKEAYCPDYGVPQQRRRLVLLASRLGPIALEKPSTTGFPRTVRDAIAHLPPLRSGESSADRFHRACRLSDLNEQRIKASKPGGCWRDWTEELVAQCHRTDMGKNYPSVYGRMEWEAPPPTITTQFFGYGNGRFGHAEQERAISLREGALLQTCPADYEFRSQGAASIFRPNRKNDWQRRSRQAWRGHREIHPQPPRSPSTIHAIMQDELFDAEQCVRIPRHQRRSAGPGVLTTPEINPSRSCSS